VREEGRIVLCGVGGQGLIAAGRVVGLALLEEGFSVRVAEVHGLAQRGGSVVVHVKFSRSPDLAPTIPEGGADAVIALEIIEALRAVKFLKARKGIMLVNDFILPPPGASRTLPRNQVLTALKKVNAKLVLLPASKAARELGSFLLTNSVMLGAAYGAGLFPIERKSFEKAIREGFRRAVELNLRAFSVGERLWRERGE